MITLVSRLVGAAAMASGRPVATMFAVQMLFWLWLGTEGLPSSIRWSVSPLAVMLCGLAVLVEAVLQHTPDVDELLRSLYLDKVAASLVTLPASLLLLSVPVVSDVATARAIAALTARGVPSELATDIVHDVARGGAVVLDELRVPGADFSLTAHATDTELLQALQVVAESNLSPGIQAIYLGIALTLNLGLTILRGWVKETVEDIGLEGLWPWLEGGGIFVGAVLIIFLPQLLLLFTATFVAAMVAAWFIRTAVRALVDRLRRRPCPHCETNIRKEAVLCKACGRRVEPLRVLAPIAPARAEASAVTLAAAQR